MKKNVGKIMAGIFALGLVFAFAGCVNPSAASNGDSKLNWTGMPTFVPPDGPSGGTLTITGLEDFNGKHVFVMGSGNTINIVGMTGVNNDSISLPEISGGTVSVPLWVGQQEALPSISAFNGTGTFAVIIFVADSAQVNSGYNGWLDGMGFESVVFSNGSATLNYNDGTPVSD